MPCDGNNPNCDRRRELLSQLKCLVSSMDQKKPCEWDEPPCPPPAFVPGASTRDPTTRCMPVKAVKSVNFRGGVMYRCECIKRNGLQDRCMMTDCMGRPECMTKLYPICNPGRAALLKLTDLGDTQAALEKFYAADKARESALAAYCRLVAPEMNGDGSPCPPPLFITPPSQVQAGYQQQCNIPDCQPCHQNPGDQRRPQQSCFPCQQGPGDQQNKHCQPCYQFQSSSQPQPVQLPYQSCHQVPGDCYRPFCQQSPKNQDVCYSGQRNKPQYPYQSCQVPQFQAYQPAAQSAPCMVPNYVHC